MFGPRNQVVIQTTSVRRTTQAILKLSVRARIIHEQRSPRLTTLPRMKRLAEVMYSMLYLVLTDFGRIRDSKVGRGEAFESKSIV